MKIIFSIILTFFSISASSQVARICEMSAIDAKEYAEKRDLGENKAKMISELIAWGKEMKKGFKSVTEMQIINDIMDDRVDRIIWVFHPSNSKYSPDETYNIKFDSCINTARSLQRK